MGAGCVFYIRYESAGTFISPADQLLAFFLSPLARVEETEPDLCGAATCTENSESSTSSSDHTHPVSVLSAFLLLSFFTNMQLLVLFFSHLMGPFMTHCRHLLDQSFFQRVRVDVDIFHNALHVNRRLLRLFAP